MTENEKLREENKRLREALELFTIAFKSRPAKLDHSWSFGYWDPTPKDLTIANLPQFNAVIKYGAEEIRTIQLATGETQ